MIELVLSEIHKEQYNSNEISLFLSANNFIEHLLSDTLNDHLEIHIPKIKKVTTNLRNYFKK